MKNNSERPKQKSYRSKVAVSIVFSTLIACVAEMVLISGLSFSMDSFSPVLTVILLLAGVVIFSVSFFIFQKRSFDYIDRISEAVRDISEGNLNARLEVAEDDEFSEIAMNLNSMTEEIKQLMDRERESERSKNELITNVAHDLRTPLTSIIGYLDLLDKKKDIPEETRNQYISIAFSKTRKLQKLIEDLFGFTKLNYGKIAMHVEKVDIVKLLSQLMDEFYPNFAEKELQYGLTSNLPAAVITADPNLLARLFDNLINNAIKYGSEGKRVDVKINADSERVAVAVINYGRVIPEKELQFVFDKFYRVEQSRNGKTGGTGLGLAIARNIVDMHGGNIRVESDLKGTRFIVELKVNFDIDRENFENAGS